MPEISRFYGMSIKMLFNDDAQHNKPHIHIYSGEFSASVALDGEMLAGSLPDKKFALLRAWMIIHEDELYAAWNNAVRGQSFERIEPLQ